MVTTPPIHRTSAALRLPKRKALASALATSIVNAMTDNPSFPDPTPPLAVVPADLAAFEAAEALALTRVKGAVITRNEKYAALHADLRHLMAYVQQVADRSPASAQSIIESAGFSVRKTTTRVKNELEAVAGAVPGSVKLLAKAVDRRASYEWQFSIDQETWTSVPTTLQARTVIAGLTSLTVCSFRFRGITKTGEGPYSQVVRRLVR